MARPPRPGAANRSQARQDSPTTQTIGVIWGIPRVSAGLRFKVTLNNVQFEAESQQKRHQWVVPKHLLINNL
jgi:hypothetical protein